MTEAVVLRAVTDVTIVKGETSVGDRGWLTLPDGTVRHAVIHVIHDLPHLVVESVFRLDDGLWGTLAEGGFPAAAREVTRRNGHLWLVTDVSFDEPAALDEPAARNRPGHLVAKAAVNAVVNRWGDGPDTPAGVRTRLRARGPGEAALADRLDDEAIRIAAAGVRRVYRRWRVLPPGGALRLTWPLGPEWLPEVT
ncbi:MAG TPA: hypothetical protein VF482_20450 [Trebonia sp.]